MKTLSGISVITPTRGRPGLAHRLLTSVRQAAKNLDLPSEVIVVDDSGGEDAQQIEAACLEFDAQYVRGPRKVGAKRNVGASRAKYDLLLFLDSDCAADENLLREHVEAHAKAASSVGAIAGPTVMDGESFKHWHVMDESMRYNQPYSWPFRYERLLWCTTSNLSVQSDKFWQIQGFDETTFTVVGGEDIDLCVRLLGKGYTTLSNPNAVALHAREAPGLLPIARRMITYGEADTYLCVRHPERTEFYPNPVGLVAVAMVLSLAFTQQLLLTVGAAFGIFLLLIAGETLRRSVRKRTFRHVGRRLLAVVVDCSFELGAFFGAVRHGRLNLIFKRFEYVPRNDFVKVRD